MDGFGNETGGGATVLAVDNFVIRFNSSKYSLKQMSSKCDRKGLISHK